MNPYLTECNFCHELGVEYETIPEKSDIDVKLCYDCMREDIGLECVGSGWREIEVDTEYDCPHCLEGKISLEEAMKGINICSDCWEVMV